MEGKESEEKATQSLSSASWKHNMDEVSPRGVDVSISKPCLLTQSSNVIHLELGMCPPDEWKPNILLLYPIDRWSCVKLRFNLR